MTFATFSCQYSSVDILAACLERPTLSKSAVSDQKNLRIETERLSGIAPPPRTTHDSAFGLVLLEIELSAATLEADSYQGTQALIS